MHSQWPRFLVVTIVITDVADGKSRSDQLSPEPVEAEGATVTGIIIILAVCVPAAFIVVLDILTLTANLSRHRGRISVSHKERR